MAFAAIRASVVLLVAVGGACSFDPSGIGSGSGRADAGPADAGVIDARPPPDGPDAAPADASDCPAPCTQCLVDGTCRIECGPGECSGGLVCPPDRPCEVRCVGKQACETGLIDCTLASRCDVLCMGDDACDQGVRCAGSSCTVTCDGKAACEDMGVECNADSCDITCNGDAACASHVCCAGEACDSDECSSSGGGCCSCSGC